jgi:hypothetical protein
MMNILELIDALKAAGFDGGYAIKVNKIILWENAEPIPSEFSEYVDLDTELNHGS